MPTATFDDNAAPGMGADNNRKLWVEFHMEAMEDPAESDKAGRPIFKETEFITIMIPGDKDNNVVRPVREMDKQQFAQQYAAFKAGLVTPITGTPLEELPFLNKAMRAEFASLGIKTAEHIRDMPDSVAQKFVGIHAVKKRVQDFLDAAAGNAPIQKMRSELEQRDGTISTLQKALEEQGKKIEELMKAKAKTL